MYSIEYSKDARKVLISLPSNTSKHIITKIEDLAVDPYSVNNNVKKLSGREAYRLRIGNWRVIYEIMDKKIILLVVSIGSRGGIYK